MTKLGRYIMAPKGSLDEMIYDGNIGFEEMVKFYQNASDADAMRMGIIVKRGDWESFKKLIKKVTGTQLK